MHNGHWLLLQIQHRPVGPGLPAWRGRGQGGGGKQTWDLARHAFVWRTSTLSAVLELDERPQGPQSCACFGGEQRHLLLESHQRGFTITSFVNISAMAQLGSGFKALNVPDQSHSWPREVGVPPLASLGPPAAIMISESSVKINSPVEHSGWASIKTSRAQYCFMVILHFKAWFNYPARWELPRWPSLAQRPHITSSH